MLNLDTEDWGELFIGCAGGGDSKLWLEGLPLQPAPEGLVPFEVRAVRAALRLGGPRRVAIAPQPFTDAAAWRRSTACH